MKLGKCWVTELPQTGNQRPSCWFQRFLSQKIPDDDDDNNDNNNDNDNDNNVKSLR